MLGSWGRAVVLGLLAGAAAFFGATAGLSGLPAGVQLASATVAAAAGALVVFLQSIAPLGEVRIPGQPPDRTAGALPAMTHQLVGRRRQMIEALRWLRPRSGLASWAVVGGLPGVGKTAFALVVASRLHRREYPGPVVFVRLRRDGPLRDPRARTALKVAARRGRHDQRRDSEAVSAVVERLAEKESLSDEEVLESILRAMKVPATKIAVDADKRRQQLTTALTGQRALLVLDAATSAAQVRDIDLPAGCAAIVTSTDELRLLGDKPVHEIWLRHLTLLQGLRLLAQHRLLGRRAWRQPWCARRLVRACGGLPQELMLRAGELRGRFDKKRSLCEAVQAQLASIAAHDPRPNIWTALAVTYEQLDDHQARAFQMVGLLDGIAIDAPLLAAALGPNTTEDEATRLLRELVGKNLLEPIGRDADHWLPSRLLPGDADHWLPHPLVRVYACAMASLDLPEEERQAALDRTVPVILRRAKGLADLLDSSVARVYPELAALAQAAMDEEWEHGAAVVDRAVAEGLDLIASLKDEGVDLLLELLSRPHMLRSDNVIHNLAKAAESAGDEDVARRARSMLKTDPRRPPASGGSSTTDQVPAADKLHQPSPGTGDNGMAYGPAESQTLGRELSPAYIGPEPPRAWGVAIWAEGFLPQAPVTVELDGYVIDQLYTDAGGAITNYETTSPGSTPPRSLRVSGWVEPGAPSPTGGSDLWPIYD